MAFFDRTGAGGNGDTVDAKFADRQHALRHTVGRFLFTTRPALYVAIIIGAALAAYGYKQRTEGLFSCQASGYSVDRYLAYCQTTGYGEYGHGAFWFGFEPAAL